MCIKYSFNLGHLQSYVYMFVKLKLYSYQTFRPNMHGQLFELNRLFSNFVYLRNRNFIK